MNLKDFLKLDEGFSSYTVNGSDTAADAFSNMCDAIAKSLNATLKEKSSKFNTPGYVNVAMIVKEYLMPSKLGVDHSEIRKVVKAAQALLVQNGEDDPDQKKFITSCEQFLKEFK